MVALPDIPPSSTADGLLVYVNGDARRMDIDDLVAILVAQANISVSAGVKPYATTAAGLAGTADGGYFAVIPGSASPTVAMILYKRSGSSALEQSRITSEDGVGALIGAAAAALDAAKANKGVQVTRSGLVGGSGGSFAGDLSFDVPAASGAETTTGSISNKAVTPAGNKAALDAKVDPLARQIPIRVDSVASSDGVTYTATRTPALGVLQNGDTFEFVPNVTSGATPTLNLGDGAKPIRDIEGTPLVEGDLRASRTVILKVFGVGSNPQYRVVAGVLGAKSQEPLQNLFANGAADPDGGELDLFGDIIAENTSHAVTLGAASAEMQALGVKRSLIAAGAASGAPSLSGVFSVGSTSAGVPLNISSGVIFNSVLVRSSAGAWTDVLVYAQYRNSDGTTTTNNLTEFDAISSTLRRYKGNFAPESGKTVKRIDIGQQANVGRTTTYEVGGPWVSHLARGGSATIRDTAFPNWGAARRVTFAALLRRLEKLEAKTTAQKLKADLENPLKSVSICLPGDSLTWGATASNISATTPRAQQLSDVRNTVDPASPSFANLFHRFLSKAYFSGAAFVAGDPGVVTYRDVQTTDPASDPEWGVKSRDTISKLSKVVAASGAASNHYLNLESLPNAREMLDRTFTGDEITLIFSRISSDPAATVAYQIDENTPVSVSWAGSTAFGQSVVISTTFGTHRLRVWSDSAFDFRLEEVRHNRRLRVRNQGIYGSNTQHWLKSENRLYPGVLAEDQHVILMLGTNNNAAGASPAALRFDLSLIISDLIADGKNVILMTPPPEFGTLGFEIAQTAMAYRSLADQFGLSLIDNARCFVATPDSGIQGTYITPDNVHLTDAGHKAIFRNMLAEIGLAKTFLPA